MHNDAWPALGLFVPLALGACAAPKPGSPRPQVGVEDTAGEGQDSGGPPDSGAEPITAELELGVGRLSFSALGPEVGLVYGPQGGWHIEPAVRVHGAEPEGLLLRWSAVDAASGEDLIYPITATLSSRSVLPTADGGWDRVGDLLIFDVRSDADVLGRALRMGAQLLDAEGRTLGAAEAEVRVVCCG